MLLRSAAPSWLTRGPWLTTAVALLLALHAILAIGGIYGRSVTSDETAHLTAGVAYWQFADYRLQPENGNLPQRWGALPVIASGAKLDPRAVPGSWRTSMVWLVAQNFLFDSGQDADAMLFLARCAMVSWSVAAGLMVFIWAKTLWRPAAGLLALSFFAFSPTTLANGPLVTSDMCAAFFLLAASYAAWRLSLQPSGPRIVVTGLVVGLACVAKMSAVLLVPTAVLVLVVLVVAWASLEKHESIKKARSAVGALLLSALVAVAVIWTFFGWRYSTVNPAAGIPLQDSPYLPWSKILESGGLVAKVVEFARTWHLLPEPFLYGFAFVIFFSAERGAFLVGNYSTTGWWWFFPFTFLVKSTLGELLLSSSLLLKAGLGASKTLRIQTLANSSLLPLFAFALVYGLTSILGHLNIGHRHILPLYLVLFVLGGSLFAPATSRFFHIVGLIALAMTGVESLANFPDPLAYFNQAAGGPKKGWQLLADSSLDWGQDVAPMAKWVSAHRQPHEHVYLATFGTADPWHEGIPGTLLSPYFALGQQRNWYDLGPGLYCVSATMLQDVYGIRPGPWDPVMEHDYQLLRQMVRAELKNGGSTEIPSIGFHANNPLWLLDRLRFARLCLYLRVRRPEAVVNHTQFIYRLSPKEINIVTDRPFSELAELITASAPALAP